MLALLARGVSRQSLPPALLLGGPSGVGKRTMAVALAQALNCPTPTRGDERVDACGDCPSCRRIAKGVHPDVVIVEPGDKVLGMSLDHGGHLTHGSPVNFSGLTYDFVAYGVGGTPTFVLVDEHGKVAGYSAADRDVVRRPSHSNSVKRIAEIR